MSLHFRDVFFPSPERIAEMSERKKMTIITTMCAFVGAAALAASNAGDYYASEKDLATLTERQVQAAATDYIEHYKTELGFGGKILNYGLYRSAKNHTGQ